MGLAAKVSASPEYHFGTTRVIHRGHICERAAIEMSPYTPESIAIFLMLLSDSILT